MPPAKERPKETSEISKALNTVQDCWPQPFKRSPIEDGRNTALLGPKLAVHVIKGVRRTNILLVDSPCDHLGVKGSAMRLLTLPRQSPRIQGTVSEQGRGNGLRLPRGNRHHGTGICCCSSRYCFVGLQEFIGDLVQNRTDDLARCSKRNPSPIFRVGLTVGVV
jgi:hypothetical protein